MTDWLGLLSDLAGVTPAVIWKAMLVFLRVGAAMALLPAFGEQSLSVRVRLVAAVAFTAVVAPAVVGGLPGPEAGVVGPALGEVGAGLALGFGLRLLILAIQVAGTIAAQAISLSQLTAGAGPEPVPAVSQFLVTAALALGAALGLHVRAAELLILSYQAVPAGSLPAAGAFAEWGLAETGRMLSLAFALAAPFQVASVLYNLALGIINRAMPQFMVTMIGAPALSLGGLALLALAAPVMLSAWVEAFQSRLVLPFEVAP